MIKFESKGIYEIRRTGKEIRLIYKTNEDAWGAYWKQFQKVMKEVNYKGVF